MIELLRSLVGLGRKGRSKRLRSDKREPPHSAEEEYALAEASHLNSIRVFETGLPVNLAERNYALAVGNYGRLAQTHVGLGLLHWRKGLDPRPDFEKAIGVYERMSALAREHQLMDEAWIPIVYAMLSLMGRQSRIDFDDRGYHRHHRWPCYECCVVHALHDQPLDEYHSGLLEKYLEKNTGRADLVALTYLQLLGLRPNDQPRDDLVKLAETNWKRRRGNMFFDGWPWFGYGANNDLYVDVYLAAVLHKIGWDGESVHRWRW